MDVTDASPQRLAVAIERFLAGDTIENHGVTFSRYGGRSLTVNCFSDWAPERSTPEHAKEKIARAKSVLEALKTQAVSFQASASVLPHEYWFCYNYGQGSIALAKEVDGHFEWLYSPNDA